MNVSQSDILIDLFNDQETNNWTLRKVNGIPRRHCATIDAFCLKSQGTNGSTAVCKRTRIYSHTKLWHPILQNKPKTEHYPWQSSSQIIQNFVWLPADFLRIAVAFLKNWTSWTKKTSQAIAMVLFWLRRVSETCCKWQETWWKKYHMEKDIPLASMRLSWQTTDAKIAGVACQKTSRERELERCVAFKFVYIF